MSEYSRKHMFHTLRCCWMFSIMLHLGDKDRTMAAQTCRAWRNAFDSPILWRRRVFKFVGIRAPFAAEKACGWVEVLGRHLRHLRVECGHPSLQTARPVAQAMEIFLVSLSRIRSKVLSFEATNLDFAHGWRFYEAPRSKLVAALAAFLKKQKYLRRLDLSSAKLTLRDGTTLLESMGRAGCKGVLTTIVLRDFYDLSVEAFQQTGFRRALRQFSNVRQIYLNYAYLDDVTLLSLAKRWRHSLSTLEILVESVQHSEHAISPSHWHKAVDVCPHMQVVCHFLGMMTLGEYRRVLVRGMPLVEVDILSCDTFPADTTHPQDERLGDILRHVAQSFHGRLERFRLSMDHRTVPPVDEALLHLFRSCPELQQMSVNCALSLPTVESICRDASHRVPGVLEKLELRVRDLTRADVMTLSNITEKYLDPIGYRRIEIHPDF